VTWAAPDGTSGNRKGSAAQGGGLRRAQEERGGGGSEREGAQRRVSPQGRVGAHRVRERDPPLDFRVVL